MDLKLNVSKKGLSTTEEVINEEYTLRYGHIFRGLSAYEYAVKGGFEGTKEEYEAYVGNIGNLSEEAREAAADARAWARHAQNSADNADDANDLAREGAEAANAAATNANQAAGRVETAITSATTAATNAVQIANQAASNALNIANEGADIAIDIATKASEAIKKSTYQPITHSELITLRNEGKLAKGAFYRITDYKCTTSQADTQAVNHPFDIIVQALDERTLSENAQAIAQEGDTYFANAKLEAWQLKYAVDNDTARFSWAQKETAESPAKWICAWGVLEERYDNGASTNYTEATIYGEQKYLYRPTQPTSYLNGKTFYRYEGREVKNLEDASELYFVTQENPFDIGEQYSTMLVIYAPTGHVIAQLETTNDYGETTDNDEVNVWNTYFGDALEMKTYGDTIDINGEVYYKWEHWDDSTMLDNWALNNSPFVTNEGTKIVYNGSTDGLYYALDGIVGKDSIDVFDVTDGNHIYKYDDEELGEDALLDNISYKAYIAPQEEGKGVVYQMIDEHNNNYPYDFKNIQFLHDGEWYYSFSREGNDLSLSDLCVNNYLSPNSTRTWSDNISAKFACKLPMVSFNALSNNSGKFIGFANNKLDVPIKRGFISSRRVEAFIWDDGLYGKDAEVENLYLNTTDPCTNNNISGNVKEFVVGSKSQSVTRFSANRIRCPKRQLSGQFVCMANKFVGNEVDFMEASKDLEISNGSITSCRITNTWYGDAKDTISFGANTILQDCDIRIYNSLTVNYANTTSSTAPLRFLNIDARGWNTTTITIPSDFPANSPYELKVAKNSKGEIKMWCDADLAN